VAVVAYRLIGLGVRRLFFKQGHRCAVEISHVCVQDIRRYSVLIHDIWIGVAAGAQLWRFQAESSRGGVAIL
jgi:hypothetical protein